MKENSNVDTVNSNEFKDRFPKVLSLISEAIDRPFRPKGVLNSASLEGVLISLLEMDNLISKDDLRDRYADLMASDSFKSVIVGSTTDTLILKKRILIAKSFLENGSFEEDDGE